MRASLVLLVAVTVLTAGCGGNGGGGGDPIVANAAPATVDEPTRSETGYERVGETTQTVNTSFTITIQGDVQSNPTFAVTATVHRTVYARPLDGGRATVGLLSVPTVRPSEALASRINPVGDRAPAALVANATGLTASGLTHRENRTVTMLGNETTLQVYDGTVTRDGTRTDVRVAVATVRAGTDEVTAVFVYPPGAEQQAAFEGILAGVEHGG
jgi:hypothetical protein